MDEIFISHYLKHFFIPNHSKNLNNYPYMLFLLKYRCHATNNPLVLISTDLDAGHNGNVSQLAELDNRADQFAFIFYHIHQFSDMQAAKRKKTP